MKNNSSFRDPSGFVFKKNNIIYRQINSCYSENYELLMESGLYKELTERNLLIEHKEEKCPPDIYKIIKHV